MSPNVNNFVSDLVTMAKALENEPILEQRIEALTSENNHLKDTVAARETSIISLKSQIEDLNAKVRSLEVERDDASFRVLELEDKVAKSVAFFGNMLGMVDHIRNELDPPKPESVTTQEPVEDQRATDTTNAQHSGDVSSLNTFPEPEDGQVVPQAPIPDTPSPGVVNYNGRFYEDEPNWISREDWIKGGGTDYTYDYRSNRSY